MVWKKYNSIPIKGKPCVGSGLYDFTVISNDKVQFYSIQNDQNIPEL